VFRNAQSHSDPRAGRGTPLIVAAAAALLLLAGLFVLVTRGGDDAVELDVASPVEQPAACSGGFEVLGRLSDDPPGRCQVGAVVDSSPDGYETPVFVGAVGGAVIDTANGWMIDLLPRPELTEPVALPPDGAGGAIMLRRSEPIEVDQALDFELELAIGHQDYRGDRDPGSWFEVMITPATAPGELRDGPLYLSDWFGGSPTLGCRIQLDGNTVCRLTTADDQVLWQASFVDDAGTEPSTGGFERDGLRFTPCTSVDVVADCLNRVRIRFEDNTLQIDLDGQQYFRQAGLPDLPNGLTGDMQTWVAVVTSRSEAEHLRFHGD